MGTSPDGVAVSDEDPGASLTREGAVQGGKTVRRTVDDGLANRIDLLAPELRREVVTAEHPDGQPSPVRCRILFVLSFGE